MGDWGRQAEKVYENSGHVLRADGATPASVVKETTWVLSIDSWRQHGAPVRRALYKGDYPASTLVEIPGLARPEFLVEIEVIAAMASSGAQTHGVGVGMTIARNPLHG